MSSLRINYLDESEIKLSKFSFDKDNSELIIEGANDDFNIPLKIKTPFSFKNLPDNFFDSETDLGEVYLMRNASFGQSNILKLKCPNADENKSCAYIFSLKGILEDDFFTENHEKMIPYAVGSLILLLKNKASLISKIPNYRTDGEYNIFDFYEEDLIVCAFSTQQVELSDQIRLSLFFSLNQYGFYLISNKHRDFLPIKNELQDLCFEEIIPKGSGGFGKALISLINERIVIEPYFFKYIQELVNQNQNHLIKFFLSYQCFEILIDQITKKEISEKVCSTSLTDLSNGFKLLNKVKEIGSESYRLKKLFNHYSEFVYKSDYHTSKSISNFLSKYINNYQENEYDYGSKFYEFRNHLVHNLRLVFDGNDSQIESKENELKNIISEIEFLTIQAILTFKI